jgi:opacity protein-like surface antigen
MRAAGFALVIVVVAVLVPASPASAQQWFVDGYVGAAITSNDELTFTTFGVEREQDVNYKSSAVFGVRGGKWFAALPWLGLAADISYFRPTEDVQVFPITLLLMARYGLLKSEEFKDGRLQPYAALGGGLFISDVDGPLGFVEASGTSTDIGLDARLGVAYHFETNWAGFLEYRFTHVSPTFDVNPFGGRTDGDTTLDTSHFVLGVSYRF